MLGPVQNTEEEHKKPGSPGVLVVHQYRFEHQKGGPPRGSPVRGDSLKSLGKKAVEDGRHQHLKGANSHSGGGLVAKPSLWTFG